MIYIFVKQISNWQITYKLMSPNLFLLQMYWHTIQRTSWMHSVMQMKWRMQPNVNLLCCHLRKQLHFASGAAIQSRACDMRSIADDWMRHSEESSVSPEGPLSLLHADQWRALNVRDINYLPGK